MSFFNGYVTKFFVPLWKVLWPLYLGETIHLVFRRSNERFDRKQAEAQSGDGLGDGHEGCST